MAVAGNVAVRQRADVGQEEDVPEFGDQDDERRDAGTHAEGVGEVDRQQQARHRAKAGGARRAEGVADHRATGQSCRGCAGGAQAGVQA